MSSGYKIVVVVLVLLFGGSAKAQQLLVYHPGQEIKITVAFEGPDAGKISLVQMSLQTQDAASNQPGFLQSMDSGNFKTIKPNTFEISYKIPENQASGDYRLIQVRATIDRDAPIALYYRPPADFPVKTLKVENPRTIVKPTVDVKVP
jgi:hypothetical protein